MQAVDREIHLAKALVIDANASSRSLMSAQLRDLGVASVRQVARIEDARLTLEALHYDIVLCELGDESAPVTGQDLLDELRRERLLPYSTVFFLVAGRPTYVQAQDAAEATVDGYLVRPYSGAALFQRLQEVRRRKRSMAEVYAAIQRQEFARAAGLAQARFDTRSDYWLFAGQLACELWLRADQPARALALCSEVNALRPLGWSRVGAARARLAGGELSAARQLLDEVVVQMPELADGHDLLGRVLVEQGEFARALQAFRNASLQSPGCLLRLQHRGTLAFYEGSKEEALTSLERTVASGRKSKLFDALCLALIGLLRFDAGDARGVAAVGVQIATMAAAFPQSQRLLRMQQVVQALVLLQARKPDEAMLVARLLAAAIKDRGTDLEAASLTIALWARLPAGEVPLKEFDALLRSAGLRFCVSHASAAVLAASADIDKVAADLLRKCQGVVNAWAQQALEQSMSGDPEAAVSTLLKHGEETRNAKLIEMAGALLRRHATRLAEAQADVRGLQQRLQALQDGWCGPLTHIAGVRRSARTPGGVVLRT